MYADLHRVDEIGVKSMYICGEEGLGIALLPMIVMSLQI